MKSKSKAKWIDKADAEIMDWFYEVIKVNFGATMIQDSTELRDILGKFYDLLNKLKRNQTT